MKTKSNQFPIFAFLLLSFFITGCEKNLKTLDGKVEALKPEISLINQKFNDIDLNSVVVEFSAKVKNPYPVAIENPRFRYSLEVLGKEFTSGDSEIKTNFGASRESTFTFPVRIEYRKVLLLFDKLKDANEASFLLRGTLAFAKDNKAVEIPVERKGSFPIFRMPEFHNVRIDSTDPTLLNIGVKVKADLKNPNSFKVGVNDLRYTLMLGSMTVGEIKAETDRSIEPGRFGKISIEGRLSVAGTLVNVLNGSEIGEPRIEITGTIDTPYGKIKVKDIGESD